MAGVSDNDRNNLDRTSLEELEAEQRERRASITEINLRYEGQSLPEDVAQEWNRLNRELDETDELIAELRARHERVAALADNDKNREEGATFQTARPSTVRGDDIYDLSTVRVSLSNPETAARELRDRARRSIDSTTFPHPSAKRSEVQEHVERILGVIDDPSAFARHILLTGSPSYHRAFGRGLSRLPLSGEEQRALSLTGASGGFAVPYQLDPTIIPTSNFSVNPYRAISRVVNITVDEWRGVTSGAVTASYALEAAAATDNSPTLTQPTISTERAQAFIPFSIEIGQDWGSLQAEMAALIQEAKDDLEATKFTTGTGTNEPQGVITGATNLVTAGGTAAFAVADVYLTEQSLPPRYRPRAVWVGNRAQYNRVRQFDTAGGASLWTENLRAGLDNQVPTPGNTGYNLIGYSANEASAMDSVLTTGSKILVLGDFSRYVIVERIGMSIDLIPHLFDGAGTPLAFPTGQRGLYAFWRNSAKVVDANGFRVLRTG